MKIFLLISNYIFTEPLYLLGPITLFAYILYRVYKLGWKNIQLVLKDKKNYLLFLAYFFKLVGLGLCVFFLFVLYIAYEFDISFKEARPFILMILVSLVFSLVGNFFVKKLTKVHPRNN